MALKHIYQLTNLHFRGSRIMEYPNGSWWYGTLDFIYKDVPCTLKQVASYNETCTKHSGRQTAPNQGLASGD